MTVSRSSGEFARTLPALLPPTPLNASLILLLSMVAVSLGATFDIVASLENVLGVLLGTMVFWTCTRWVNTPDRLRTATLAFILAGCALALVGLLGRLPPAVRGLPGAAGGFHPDAVAGCLVLFVPLQLALLTAARTRRLSEWRLASFGWLWSTTVQGLLLLLTGGTLLLTQSRGAWVGILVAFMAYLGWHSRQTRTVAILAIGAVIVAAIVNGPERLIDLAIGQSGPGMAGDVSGRVEIWSRAIYAIQDFPLTGMGMNTFRKVMPVFYPALLTSPEFEVAHAHNHLLQAALDLGLPGLVAYLSIWLIAAARLVDVYRRRVGVYRVLANGLGAGLIAHFSFGMTDAIPLGAKVGILFWLTLALVVSLHRVSLSEAPGHVRSRAEPTYSENPA